MFKKFLLSLLITLPLYAEETDTCVIEYPKNCQIQLVPVNQNEFTLAYTCTNKDNMTLATEGLKKKFFSKLFSFGNPKLFYVKVIFRRIDKEGDEVSLKCY